MEHSTTIFRVSWPSFTRSTPSEAAGLVIDLEKYVDLPKDKRATAVDTLREICATTPDITHLWIVNDAVTDPVWEALRPLTSVKQLEIRCGTERSSNIPRIDEIGKDWPLESLWIDGASVESLCNSKLSTLHELRLWSCDSLIPPPGIEGQLHRLVIQYGGACDQFVTFARHTQLLKDLEELIIYSINLDEHGKRTYSQLDFLKCLKELKNLKTLRLVLSDGLGDTNMTRNHPAIRPDFFPENLEHLQIAAHPRVSKYLGSWWKRIRNPEWLPKLKDIEFDLDVCYDETSMLMMSPSEFSNERLFSLYGNLEEEARNISTLALDPWSIDRYGADYNHMGSAVQYSIPAFSGEVDDGEPEFAEEYIENNGEGEPAKEMDGAKLESFAYMQRTELMNELQILRKDVVVL